MIYFKQCTMAKRTDDDNYQFMTSWLPEKFAVKGKHLELKNDGEWEGRWVVTAVGAERLDEKTVEENSRDYRSQRKASDVFRGSSKK